MTSLTNFISVAGTLVTTKEQADILGGVAEMAETILSGLGNILTTVSGMGDFITNAEGELDLVRVSAFLQVIQTTFNELKTFLPNIISGIMTAFTGVDVAVLKSKVNVMGSVITFLTNVLDMTSTLNDLASGAAGEGGSLTTGLANIAKLFTAGEGAGEVDFFDIVQSVVDGAKSIVIGRLPNFTPVTTLFTNLKSVTEAMSEIANAEINTAKREIIASAIQGIKSSMEVVGGATFKAAVAGIANINLTKVVTVSSQLQSISESISNIQSVNADGIFGLETVISSFQPIIDAIDNVIVTRGRGGTIQKATTFNSLLTKLGNVSENLAIVNRNLLPIVTTTNENMRERVSALMGTITDTVSAINNMGAIDLSTTMRRLENNFGLGNTASYTINNENFNVTLNLNVTFDAGTFVEVLFDQAIERSTSTGAAASGPRAFTPASFNPATE
jgi:hypothetical protein